MTVVDQKKSIALPPAFRRLVHRAVVLPLVLATIIAGIFAWQVTELVRANSAVEQCDRIIDHADSLQKLLIDMETGLRGYVITDKPAFLEPYEKARQPLIKQFNDFKGIVAGDARESAWLATIIDHSDEWQMYAAKVIAEAGDQARATVLTQEGKDLMDAMRASIGQFVTTQTAIRDHRSRQARLTAVIVLGSGMGACFLVGLILAFLARSQLFSVAQTYMDALGVAETREKEKTQLLASERAARSTAEHASRMKDEFLATLSHELRTPLNAILGWAQLLRTGKSSQNMEQGLSTIERNARIQTQLIEDLLDMSRIISGKLRLDVQRVSPLAFIEAAIDTIRPAAEAKGVRLEKLLDPLAGPISGDPSRLQQVVWNLLSNAVKFTPRDGKVQVLLQRVNSHLEISVADTGQGIKPDFLPWVFERFRQADSSTTRKFGGLGLGLAIVKQLVELHGGSVRVKSPGEGAGATFVVNLPLSAIHSHTDDGERLHPRTAEPSAIPADHTSTSLRGVKVLVVDDEADARELIRRVLEESEASVTLAASAAVAMTLLTSFKPDVLVSDIGMPEMDGYEFLKAVRALDATHGRKIPAVALTAFARSEDRTRALLAGYQSHLSKPVEPTELVATIASVAGRTVGSRTE